MQRLEVSSAVRPLCGSLGVKGLVLCCLHEHKHKVTFTFTFTSVSYWLSTQGIQFRPQCNVMTVTSIMWHNLDKD